MNDQFDDEILVSTNELGKTQIFVGKFTVRTVNSDITFKIEGEWDNELMPTLDTFHRLKRTIILFLDEELKCLKR